MDIGLKIRRLRIEKKLEQIELANMMSMSSNMISMYELGKKRPSVKAIVKMAEIFEVSPNYFLEEKVELIRSTNTNSSTITEKAVEELKVQLEFLRRNFEAVVQENRDLVRIISGNFPGGDGFGSSPLGEADTLMAA